MRKNRKWMAGGILAITALLGVSLYAYADIRDENTRSNTSSVSTEAAVTSGQQAQGSSASAAKASEAALSSAASQYGILESSVRDLEVEQEYEGGKTFWDVTFDAENQDNQYCEYEYHVSCEDGTVTHHHRECEDTDD